MTIEAAGHKDLTARVAVIVAFIVVSALLVWRIFHGLDWTDEPFYAVETWRLVLGDSLFADTLTSSQLSAAERVPLIAVYAELAGGTRGVLLFLRLCYLAACIGVALLLFTSAKRASGRLWAFLTCIPVLASIHPLTLSYNTIELLGFFAACAFMFLAQQSEGKKRGASLVLAGICCGTSFIAYPTTLLALPLFCIWLLAEPSFGAKLRNRAVNLAPFALGCAICLAVILAAVIATSSFDAVTQYLGDRTSSGSRLRTLFIFFKDIAKAFGIGAAIALVAACIVAHVSTVTKDVRLRRILKAIALTGAAAIIVWQYARVMGNFSTMQIQVQMYFAIASVGPILFLLNRHRWSQCIWMFLLGIVVSIAVYLGTSNGVNWYVYPGMLSASAVLLYCPTLVRCPSDDEPPISCNVLKVIAGFAIAALLVAFAAFFTYVYRDAPLQELDTQLQSGPGAGLITTSERADLYYNMVDTIHEYAPKEGTVLFLNVFSFGYLCTDAPPAAGNPFGPNVNTAKFTRYYELNPDRIPSVIFCVSSDYFGEKNGDVKLGAFLEAYMQEHKYSRIETPEATIFVRES